MYLKGTATKGEQKTCGEIIGQISVRGAVKVGKMGLCV